MNLAKNIFVATALTGVLAIGNLGTLEAGESSSVWRPMKPLYAISFDVGRKHVLSYFLSKNGLCDLTMIVAFPPDEPPRSNELPRLETVRFQAVIEGGKTARFDAAEGNSLEYACPMGAQMMTVRGLNQVAQNAANRD